MKRWKKGLSLLLAVCLAGSLCACGNDGGTSAPDPTPPPTEDVPQEVDVPEEDTSQDTSISEDVQQDVDMPEENFVEVEPAGLIIWESRNPPNGSHLPVAGNPSYNTVYCLDPNTGNTEVISEFNYVYKDLGGYSYERPYTRWMVRDGSLLISDYAFQGSRYLFSDDFLKFALDKKFSGSNEVHAGWMDDSGEYFDLTVALGLQSKSDFDEPVHFYSGGFLNGYFEYYDEKSDAYYHVPIDNVTSEAVQEGHIADMDGNPICGEFKPYDITAWIDDTHCLVNSSYHFVSNSAGSGTWVDSLIYDTESQSTLKYVPGDSRLSWNGVVSPDGTKIAFQSSHYSSISAPSDLYIIPMDGSDPVKIENNPFEFTNYLCPPCQLIDWR